MMTSSSPVGQFDLETVRSPLGNDERFALRCGIAALVGLAVGAAFLLVMPHVPGLVRSAWCVADTGPGCDPGSELTGQLIATVIWAVVLVGTATVVSAPLAWLAGALSGIRLSLPLVLLGPPLMWALMVLGEPLGGGGAPDALAVGAGPGDPGLPARRRADRLPAQRAVALVGHCRARVGHGRGDRVRLSVQLVVDLDRTGGRKIGWWRKTR